MFVPVPWKRRRRSYLLAQSFTLAVIVDEGEGGVGSLATGPTSSNSVLNDFAGNLTSGLASNSLVHDKACHVCATPATGLRIDDKSTKGELPDHVPSEGLFDHEKCVRELRDRLAHSLPSDESKGEPPRIGPDTDRDYAR